MQLHCLHKLVCCDCTFLFFVANLIGGHQDHLPIMNSSVTSSLFLFGKAEEKAFNRNQDQIYRVLVCFAYLKTYLLALQVFEPAERLWVSIEHPLNTCECAWTPMSEYWSSGGAHECQWVSGNSSWRPIECAWLPLSECEHPMSVHDHHWVIIERDSLWCDHEKDLICVRTEHALNACECVWMPVSEYWTPPECLWVHVNANEWVLNTPWTPIECAWMPLSEREQPLNINWVRMTTIEWVWTPNECAWTPLSQYWT